MLRQLLSRSNSLRNQPARPVHQLPNDTPQRWIATGLQCSAIPERLQCPPASLFSLRSSTISKLFGNPQSQFELLDQSSQSRMDANYSKLSNDHHSDIGCKFSTLAQQTVRHSVKSHRTVSRRIGWFRLLLGHRRDRIARPRTAGR